MSQPFTVSIPVQALQSTLRALTETRDKLNLQIAAIAAQLPAITNTTNTAHKTKTGQVDWDSLRRPRPSSARKSKSNTRPHVA